MRRQILAFWWLFGIAAGCDTSGPAQPTGLFQRAETASAPQAAPLVGVVNLANGNTVEFYDFGGRALITEKGAAYTAPTLNHQLTRQPLSTIWSTLAPSVPVPAALTQLEQELASPTPPPGFVASGTTAPQSKAGGQSNGVTSQLGHITPDSPVGCNNGCCDYQWAMSLALLKAEGDSGVSITRGRRWVQRLAAASG
jgi:hypothetical protein